MYSISSEQTLHNHCFWGCSSFNEEQVSQFIGLQKLFNREHQVPLDLIVFASCSLLSLLKSSISLSVWHLKIFLIFEFLIKIIQYVSCSIACRLYCMQRQQYGYETHDADDHESLDQPIQLSISSAKTAVESFFFLDSFFLLVFLSFAFLLVVDMLPPLKLITHY